MNMIPAGTKHKNELMAFIKAYHAFERIESAESGIASAIAPLLETGKDWGKIWLMQKDKTTIGYIVACFGYSIEFGGRDAFIDEFYVAENERGKGYGKAALEFVKRELRNFGVVAVHLEVASDNVNAERIYSSSGFKMRKNFHLMTCRLDSEQPG